MLSLLTSLTPTWSCPCDEEAPDASCTAPSTGAARAGATTCCVCVNAPCAVSPVLSVYILRAFAVRRSSQSAAGVPRDPRATARRAQAERQAAVERAWRAEVGARAAAAAAAAEAAAAAGAAAAARLDGVRRRLQELRLVKHGLVNSLKQVRGPSMARCSLVYAGSAGRRAHAASGRPRPWACAPARSRLCSVCFMSRPRRSYARRRKSGAATEKHTSTAILRSDRHLSGSLCCARRGQVLHTEEATRAHAAALEALEEGEMLVDAPRPPRAAPGAPPQAAPPPPPPLPPPPPPPPAAAAAAAAFALPARATVLAPGARRVPWIFTQLGPWGAWGLSYEQRLCPCQRVPAARPGCPARAALDSGATWYHGLPMRRTCCAAAQGVGRDACRRAQRPGGQHSCSLTASRADRALGAAAGAPPMPSRGSGSAGKRTRSALPGNACLPPPAFLTVI